MELMWINSVMKWRREGIRNSTGGVSARRVRIVRRCHRRTVQKRQGFTECTGRWPQLNQRVRSVEAVKTLASVFDWMLGHFTTGRWQGASGPTDVVAQGRGERTGCWSQLDRSVRSVEAVKTLVSAFDRTLGHFMTGRWLTASDPADVAVHKEDSE